MRDIFLGKPWHWGLVAIVTALLWWAGSNRAHVIEFNSFLVALMIGSLAVVVLILRTNKPGDQVTREVLLPDKAEDDEHDREEVRS